MRLTTFFFVVLLAAWNGDALAAEKGSTSGRELCILYTQACSGKMQTFQQKIQQIQAQIATGVTAYNPKEVDKLEMKLKEAEEQMNRVLSSARAR